MITAQPFPAHDLARFRPMIARLLRCWQEARDEGKATQPRLFSAIESPRWVLLAPVLDSLFHFYEAALGRRVVAGRPHDLSADETLLLAVMGSAKPCAGRIGCDAGRGRSLDCALCSARVMLSLAVSDPAGQ